MLVQGIALLIIPQITKDVNHYIHMLWKNLICDHAALLLPAFEIQIPLQNERRRDRVHGLAVFFLLFARLVQDLMRGDRGAALVS